MALQMAGALIRRFWGMRRDHGLRRAVKQAVRYVVPRTTGRRFGTVQPLGAGVSAGGHGLYLGSVWSDLARRDAFAVSTPAVTGRADSGRTRPRIALIGDLNLPQCRKYRVEQAAEFWRAQGAELSYAHYGDVPRAVSLLQTATHLMCYRLTSGPEVSMYLYEARRLGLPVLYDIDDPLFSVPAYATYGNMAALDEDTARHFITAAPGYLDVMNASDAVCVSTPELAQHTGQFTPRPVFMRRNYADANSLKMGAVAQMSAKQNADGVFRLAFASGSQGHEVDFARIAEPVIEFLRADRGRRLMVLGHFDKALLPTSLMSQTEWYRFSDYAGYLGTLARADCMALPLADDLFNRCKSGVRAIDAFATGVPVIADAVGDAPALIDDGETGFVARDNIGWARALAALGDTPSRAARMGRKARSQVETRWAVGGAAPAHVADPGLLDWMMA